MLGAISLGFWVVGWLAMTLAIVRRADAKQTGRSLQGSRCPRDISTLL